LIATERWIERRAQKERAAPVRDRLMQSYICKQLRIFSSSQKKNLKRHTENGKDVQS
jgi:hypothetical protein